MSMETILTIRDRDFIENAPDVDSSGFKNREAVRAVLSDDNGRIALIYSKNRNYHKLPGGGIDQGEDHASALHREIMEETGCRAEIIQEVGQIIEFRDQIELIQTSYCYTAKLIEDTGETHFTDHEASEQFAVIWADDLTHATSLFEQVTSTDYGVQYMTKRDLEFIKSASKQKL